MQTHRRLTADLSSYPDLVMVLLGLEIKAPRAFLALGRISRGMAQISQNPPDGLLHHMSISHGWRHPGFIQYWRNFDSLERFTRSEPHAAWWRHFMAKNRGCGFWHETYTAQRGIEAIYVDMRATRGLGAFAPATMATGGQASTRKRLANHRCHPDQ